MNQETEQAAPDRWESSAKFGTYAWFIVGYLAFVILWGAWVRISGSGAGCGAHWPTCNGEVIPLNPAWETVVEFTHRLSSGLSLPLVLILVFMAFRRFPKGHGARWASIGTLVFLLSEAALGAGLVKFELVAENDSIARAVTASFHLINTFILTAFAALCAWWGSHGYPPFRSKRSGLSLLVGLGLFSLLLTAMSGAITALGDTLFPTQVFTEQGLLPHLKENLASSTHFLVQLRIFHPIIAVVSGVYLLGLMPWLSEQRPDLKRACLNVSFLVVCQLLLGVINILLAAPAWIQILHLLLALGVWLASVLLWVQLLEGRQKLTRLQQQAETQAGN